MQNEQSKNKTEVFPMSAMTGDPVYQTFSTLRDLWVDGDKVMYDVFKHKPEHRRIIYIDPPVQVLRPVELPQPIQDERQDFESLIMLISRGLADFEKGINGYHDPQIQVFWENYQYSKGLCDEVKE